MKKLALIAAAFIFGLTGVAKADLPDFQFKVLDPVPPPGTVNVDGSAPFAVEFQNQNCPASATGCFFGYNTSKQTFTFLQVTFVNSVDTSEPLNFFDYLNSQPASCITSPAYPADPQGSLFAGASCGLTQDGSEYVLQLFGGNGINPGETFVLAEYGPDPSAFGVGTATVGSTPEPASIWLALSGAGALAYAIRRRRNGAFCS